jgi:outer membrane immunogenic protein
MLIEAATLLLAMAGPESPTLPRSLADEYVFEAAESEPQAQPPRAASRGRSQPSPGMEFSLGPVGGYLKPAGADHGSWFVGVQARLRLVRFLALEVSATWNETEYQSGDVDVTQYPVQVSGLIYPFPSWTFSPYLVGGGGWYYSRVDYSGALAATPDSTDRTFGAHGGIGADYKWGNFVLDADLRYIFLDPTSKHIRKGEFDFWQVTLGVNYTF